MPSLNKRLQPLLLVAIIATLTLVFNNHDGRADADGAYVVYAPITFRAEALLVQKSSATTTLSAPGTVTYAYLVTNTGNANLTGISLSDDNDNDDMSCPTTSLAPGASITCTATHTFTQAELDANGSPTPGSGILFNVVTASANEAPAATDDLAIPIMQNASIAVEKSSQTTALPAPATVAYDYLVTNTGNISLTGISLSDDNDNDDLSCPTTSLAPAANMTCTATHTFTQAELDANGSPTPGSGVLFNTVTAVTNEAPAAADDLSIPIVSTGNNPNLLRNPSFEGGWTDYDESVQIPNEWEITWETGPTGFGEEEWDVWLQPEAVHKSALQLPPDEVPLFIWDGEWTYKVFRGWSAISFSLAQDLTLPAGTYLFEINVFPDLIEGYDDEGNKIWASDPLSGEVRLSAEDQSSGWLLPSFGERHTSYFLFTVDQTETVTIRADFRGRFALRNNGWFLDHWKLAEILSAPMAPDGADGRHLPPRFAVDTVSPVE